MQRGVLDPEHGDGVDVEAFADDIQSVLNPVRRHDCLRQQEKMQPLEIALRIGDQLQDGADARPVVLGFGQPAQKVLARQPRGDLADHAVQVMPPGKLDGQLFFNDAKHGPAFRRARSYNFV